MTVHTTNLQTQIETVDGEPTGVFRYRWRCSCGRVSKRWHTTTADSGSGGRAARLARYGGARHVAAMERAK